jgi:hypothetical protein
MTIVQYYPKPLMQTHSGSSSSSGNSSSSSTSKSSASVNCSLAPASEVSSSLGINVTFLTSTDNSPVTLCSYSGGTLVRFQTEENAAGFATGKAGFGQHGELVADVSGLGDAAYSSSIGGINTLVALKGSVEILITSSAGLSNEQVLMRDLLAKV